MNLFKVLLHTLLVAGAISGAQAQGHIIVSVATGHTAQDLTAEFPVTVIDVTPNAPFALLEVLPGNDLLEVQTAMRARPDLVDFAEDDDSLDSPENVGAGKGGTVAAVFDPTAAYSENTGLFAQINFKRLLPTNSPFERIIRVAVLDTGVSSASPYLLFRTVAAANFAPDRTDWYDSPSGADTNGNGDPNEGLGHGSMVAGLIAQMCPFSKLVIARVADADGVATAWTIIRGLVFACQNGAEVINISLGSDQTIPALTDVISNYVEARGVVIVGAIGNRTAPSADAPSSIHSIICVAGLDAANHKASFSNWDGKTSQCAPCTGIKSVWWDGGMGVWSGTSFASPLVAGTIANGLRFRQFKLTKNELNNFRNLVENTGTNINALNPQYNNRLGLKLNCLVLFKAITRF